MPQEAPRNFVIFTPQFWQLSRNTRHIIIFLPAVAGMILSGCIERYYPEEEDMQTGTLVVVAHIDDRPREQVVTLSRSTSIKESYFDPVEGSFVEMERIDGAACVFNEDTPGQYVCLFPQGFIQPGMAYRLLFTTASGVHYESDFERLHPAAEVDSAYWVREDHPTSDPGAPEKGIQFYVDFEIDKDSVRYLRWELEETYEIRNPDYRTQIFDVDRQLRPVPNSEIYRHCWITETIPDIYTLDLGNVEGSTYKQMPLNFVTDETRRLHLRYSLLVRQYTLGENAFRYWDELKNNLQAGSGLYDKQPAIVPGNICNTENEEEKVIGYFSVSGVDEYRVFAKKVPDLRFRVNPYFCGPFDKPEFLYFYPQALLPVYLVTAYITEPGETGIVDKECVDCRVMENSTHIKPDFW